MKIRAARALSQLLIWVVLLLYMGIWRKTLSLKIELKEAAMRTVLLVVGTRPEGIKMMPVYHALKKAQIPVVLCSTSQHEALLTEVFELFKVRPDYELHIMKAGQDLSYITASVLEKITQVYKEVAPVLVLVQGDTTTAMAASLAAFYQRIPVGHIEAGLRTGDRYSPYPEEVNREIISLVATYHFAPTSQAVANLLAENISRDSIVCTGNTVVDALLSIERTIAAKELILDAELEDALQKAGSKKKVLLTVHRRESFGHNLFQTFAVIKKIAQEQSDTVFFYPSHPNPQVQHVLQEVRLDECLNIKSMGPLSYKDMVHLLLAVDLVVTDSGGIQEEAVSLGKPVLVLRDKSERMEGVWAGRAALVATPELLYATFIEYKKELGLHNDKHQGLYGDGTAAEQIVQFIKRTIYKDAGSLTKEYVSSVGILKEERV